MTKRRSNEFIQNCEAALADAELQAAVDRATNTADRKRKNVMAETSPAHGEAIRQQAAAIKRHALNHLADLLETAEVNMLANGFHVLWAKDAAEACDYVLEIVHRHEARKVVKVKSMLSEEIALNEILEADGIETLETDLGEYIVQLGGETPSHIVAPVIHKSKDSIRRLFEEKIAMPPTDDAVEMARYARGQLREAFLSADLGISGGNFIVAETGTLGLVTNEGNGRMATSLPPVHVALVGIEKIAATLEDYATLTQILPRSATGQKLAVYTNMINGPRRAGEVDGPEHVYVILVDNGRSQIYTSGYAEALACIRCGACMNACPVYKAAGGHSYGWVYPGPIGSVLTPLLTGLENATPLPFASSLCGSCKQVCPVDIDIPHMLLDLRHDLVEQGLTGSDWDWIMKAYATGFSSPALYHLGGKLAGFASRTSLLENLPGPLKGWTEYRNFPVIAQKPFRKLWEEREEHDGQS